MCIYVMQIEFMPDSLFSSGVTGELDSVPEIDGYLGELLVMGCSDLDGCLALHRPKKADEIFKTYENGGFAFLSALKSGVSSEYAL